MFVAVNGAGFNAFVIGWFRHIRNIGALRAIRPRPVTGSIFPDHTCFRREYVANWKIILIIAPIRPIRAGEPIDLISVLRLFAVGIGYNTILFFTFN